MQEESEKEHGIFRRWFTPEAQEVGWDKKNHLAYKELSFYFLLARKMGTLKERKYT